MHETQKLDQLYQTLKDGLRWKGVDNKVIMGIASNYLMHEKPIQVAQLNSLAKEIKKRAGFFTALPTHTAYTIAAMLDIHFHAPETQIDPYFDIYTLCVEEKFGRNVYTYLSAAFILIQQSDQSAVDIIKRAKDIHRDMKQAHTFLTSTEDLPLAVLLAMQNNGQIIQQTEDFYQRLNRNGFRKGNDLQFTSHILALDTTLPADVRVARTVELYDQFKQHGMKSKAMFYPLMGILALIPPDQCKLVDIVEMRDELNEMKAFKWQKDLNLVLAVSIYTKQLLEHGSLAETNLYTTLESILQAQQAATTAAIVAATATSTTHHSS